MPVSFAQANAKVGLGRMLKRQGTFGFKSKTLLVATDGSSASLRALKLAVFIMNENARDVIRVMTVKSESDGAADPAKLLQLCKGELIKYGVQPGKIKANPTNEVISLQAGESLPQAICREANKDENTMLIMGSAGKNAENASESKGKRCATPFLFTLATLTACPQSTLRCSLAAPPVRRQWATLPKRSCRSQRSQSCSASRMRRAESTLSRA